MLAAILLLPVFLAGWTGLLLLTLYLFIIGALFEDDWWIRGLLFLAIPVGIAYWIGVIAFPGWSGLGLLFAGYFATGVVWSIYKWIIFVKDLKKNIQTFIDEYNGWSSLSKEKKGEQLWDHLYSAGFSGGRFWQFLDQSKVKKDLNVTPHLSNWRNRGKVFSWIAYWPFSVVNYIFDRLLRDLINWIIDSLKGIYNVIAAQIMKGLQI